MLIECPECGSQVSDKAKCCPHCGYSLEDARNERAAEEAAVIAQENQAAYDATFRPNELYLAAPLPLKAFCRPFTARGRATRAEYWSCFAVFVFIGVLLFSFAVNTGVQAPLFVWTVLGLVVLANATSRRLHDAGASDALAIIFFLSILIPFLGWGFLILCGGCALFSPSVEGSNEHGPNPNVFCDNIVEAPVPCPRQNRFVWKQKTRSSKTMQRNLLVFNCPHCGEQCETEEEIQIGQHVVCPYCERKFSYGEEQGKESICSRDMEKRPARVAPKLSIVLAYAGLALAIIGLVLCKIGFESAGLWITIPGGVMSIVGGVIGSKIGEKLFPPR